MMVYGYPRSRRGMTAFWYVGWQFMGVECVESENQLVLVIFKVIKLSVSPFFSAIQAVMEKKNHVGMWIPRSHWGVL